MTECALKFKLVLPFGLIFYLVSFQGASIFLHWACSSRSNVFWLYLTGNVKLMKKGKNEKPGQHFTARKSSVCLSMDSTFWTSLYITFKNFYQEKHIMSYKWLYKNSETVNTEIQRVGWCCCHDTDSSQMPMVKLKFWKEWKLNCPCSLLFL